MTHENILDYFQALTGAMFMTINKAIIKIK
jgi:hypothetical protein